MNDDEDIYINNFNVKNILFSFILVYETLL